MEQDQREQVQEQDVAWEEPAPVRQDQGRQDKVKDAGAWAVPSFAKATAGKSVLARAAIVYAPVAASRQHIKEVFHARGLNVQTAVQQ